MTAATDIAAMVQGLSEDERSLLELMLAEDPLAGKALVPLRRAVGGDRLSYAQERLWFLEQLDPGGATYHMPVAARLSGPLRVDHLAAAATLVAERHEALRTLFLEREGEPRQRVEPPRPVRVPVVDLARLPASRRDPEARRAVTATAASPFALSQAPAWRFVLIRMEPQEHVALLVAHHLIADEWSLALVVDQITRAHGELAAGKPVTEQVPLVQYADFACWEGRSLGESDLKRGLAWWRTALAGFDGWIELPTDGEPAPGGGGCDRALALSREGSTALARLAREHGTTLFPVLAAGWLAWLAAVSDRHDITVGTSVSNRDRRELEDVVGLFVNTLLLRVVLQARMSFHELIEACNDSVEGVLQHRHVPFDLVVRELRRSGQLPNGRPFRTFFALHNAPRPSAAGSGLTVRTFRVSNPGVRADLMLDLIDGPEAIHGFLSYQRGLLTASTAEDLARHVTGLLERAAAHPQAPLAELWDPAVRWQQEWKRSRARSARQRRRRSLERLLDARRRSS